MSDPKLTSDATINNTKRTNNDTEGFNNRLKNLVGHSHPGIFHLIKIFCQELSVDEVKLQQAEPGRISRKRKRNAFMKMQERLRNLCLMYERRENYLYRFYYIKMIVFNL